MVFDAYYRLTEAKRWTLETDIPWDSIDKRHAAKDKAMLKILHDATMIESYAPVSHRRMLELYWDDVDVSGVLSIQLFEEYKHYYVLHRYLESIGHHISEKEVLAARRKNVDAPAPYKDPITQLAKYFTSEHFTGYFYTGLVARARDPVLKKILGLIAGDEFRHSGLFYDLLADKIAADRPPVTAKVMDFALHFQHFGAEVVDEVPISVKNDFKAIVTFARRIETLTGIHPKDWIKQSIAA